MSESEKREDAVIERLTPKRDEDGSSFAVRSTLPDGRKIAVSIGVSSPGRLRSKATATYIELHVEDPAGVSCEWLEPHRCDDGPRRGMLSASIASEIYEEHGNESSADDQSEAFWGALEDALRHWASGIEPRSVEGASPAVGTASDAPVSTASELREKYGTRGLSLLIQRAAILLSPPVRVDDCLSDRLEIAARDLEAVLAEDDDPFADPESDSSSTEIDLAKLEADMRSRGMPCPMRDGEQCTSILDAPGHCPSCGTIRLFEITQPRTIEATYERQLWARDAEEAIRIAEQGTAWPESYDESRRSIKRGAFSAEDVTETGYMRTEGGFTDDE